MNSNRGCILRGDLPKHTSIQMNKTSFFSPDIVPMGVNDLPDPSGHLLSDFTQDFGLPIIPGGENKIFIRGVYNGPLSDAYTVTLYNPNKNLIQWPSDLNGKNVISTQGFREEPISPNFPGSRFCLTTPFMLNPSISTDQANFFVEVKATEYQQSVGASFTERVVHTIEDLALAREETAALSAQRNIALVPTLRREAVIENSFSSGQDAATFRFMIDCRNVAVGWDVSLDFKEEGQDHIQSWIPRTTIENSGFIGFSVQKEIPANTSGTLYLTYNSNGIAPIPDWSITLIALIEVSALDDRFKQSLRPDQVCGWSDDDGDPQLTRLVPVGGQRIAARSKASLQHGTLGYTQPVLPF